MLAASKDDSAAALDAAGLAPPARAFLSEIEARFKMRANTMSDIPASRSVIVERLMPHPPEKIWRALTRAELVGEWLMQNDFEPVVGRRFNFRATPQGGWNGVTDCEVLEVTPPSRLVYSWNASGEQAADGIKSIVTWTLTPVDGGTQVRMEQAGFRPQDEPFYQGAGYGWQRMVAGLERVAGELAH